MASHERMLVRVRPTIDVSKRLTHEYHQTVLRLAHEFSNTNVAWDVSQHILNKLWDDSSSPPSSESSTIAHVCKSCGYRLHPGWKGTSLRVKRPDCPFLVTVKKNIRRREQRKRRKAARAEEMKARDHRRNNSGSRNHDATGTSTSTDSATANQRWLFLRDDPVIGILDRNVLVLTCGRCCDKTNLKGLPREQPQQPQPSGRRSHVANSTARIPKTTAPNSKTGGGVSNLSESFEHLPRLSKKPIKTPNTVNEALLLLQHKKRKKKTTQISANKKSGNLLNFLSSLNDN
jgi:hypothetical protein